MAWISSYRRIHISGTPISIGQYIGTLPVGQWASRILEIQGCGYIRSEQTLVLTDDFDPPGVPEFDLDNRHYLSFKPADTPVRLAHLRIGFREKATVQIVALFLHTPVQQTSATGEAGEVVTISLAFDAITEIRITSAPASLVDISFVPVSQGATDGWEELPGFSGPMRLPVSHPAYPCTAGESEDLSRSRNLALDRIQYGDPNRFTGNVNLLTVAGTVTLENGSAIVKGTDTQWTEELVGSIFKAQGDSAVYMILQIINTDKLLLSRSYVGNTNSNTPYEISSDSFAQLHEYLLCLVAGGADAGEMADRTIPEAVQSTGLIEVTNGSPTVSGQGTNWSSDLEKLILKVSGEATPYTIARVDSPSSLVLDKNYTGITGSGKRYTIQGILKPESTDEMAPHMSQQSPLDMTLLGSLQPAIAQALGLYWIDQTADQNKAYDYLIVADEGGALEDVNPTDISQFLERNDWELDGFIVFNKQQRPVAVLPSPLEPKVYSLPASGIVSPRNGDPNNCNAVGLRWDIGITTQGVLLPNSSVFYHLWRSDLGDEVPENPPLEDQYELITAEPAPSDIPLSERIQKPILVARPSEGSPQRPSDWPPFRLFGFDAALQNGWYSYKISGIDIFGRHSAQSEPAKWHQWTPMPEPRPWYYQDPPGEQDVHTFAVRLLDKVPPPAPAGIEAFALDSLDPTLVRDQSYSDWYSTLDPQEQDSVVGLRVRWLWTDSHMRQAPDTREFRVYFQMGSSLPHDWSSASNWQTRLYVVGFDEHLTITTDEEGQTLRTYEVFLPTPNDSVRDGLPLNPSLETPVIYAHIGVSAVDEKEYCEDDPKWSDEPWGNRPGNESRVGSPVKIFCVLRESPEPPLLPSADSEELLATSADFHGHSYFTFRWKARPFLKAHILRALDDSVFRADFNTRPRNLIDPSTDLNYFPQEADEPRWDIAKREQVAVELNSLNNFQHDTEGTKQAMIFYRQLSNDTLRILAGLPETAKAFSQLTVSPLDPDDTETADRPGPDNLLEYVPDQDLRIYIDTLDGRATNRYFYRAVYVDGAHNRSVSSLSSPPIALPNVVPPGRPTITAIVSGDRQISIKWASNQEADVECYEVYRTVDERAARSIKLMDLIHTEHPIQADPVDRPAEVVFEDHNVTPYTKSYYRIVAIDTAGNVSDSSPVVTSQAFDYGPPSVANWERLEWVKLDKEGIEYPIFDSTPGLVTAVAMFLNTEQKNVTALAQRKNGASWRSVTPWTRATMDEDRGIFCFKLYDKAVSTGPYQYRIRLMNSVGVSITMEERQLDEVN